MEYDQEFLKKFPNAPAVLGYLQGYVEIIYLRYGCFKPFDKLGIKDSSGLIPLLKNSDPRALAMYNLVESWVGKQKKESTGQKLLKSLEKFFSNFSNYPAAIFQFSNQCKSIFN